jgi:chromate transport protein ChrA
MKKTLLVLMVIAVYALHQDFWNWRKSTPLIFGVLPIGLAYHAAYSVLASIMMAVLVKFAWPKHLETVEEEAPKSKGTTGGGHA